MNELEIIRHSRIPGLTVFFNTVDYRTPHFHPEWELIWLLEQPLALRCGGETMTAHPGELLLFRPEQIHEFHKLETGATFLCLQVSPELLHLENSLTVDCVRLNEALEPARIAEIQKALADIMGAYLNHPDFAGLYCLGRVSLLFHSLFTSLPVRPVSREELLSREKQTNRMSSLIRFVDEHYMHKIRLSDFAEAEGFSMSYLSHFIKDTLNQTFQDYVTSVRVNAACQKMAATEEKLTQIAMESGFSDYRYFSNAFRKQFGMTPEQYRLSIRKPENAVIHHSIHSLERFYTDEQSAQLLAGLSF